MAPSPVTNPPMQCNETLDERPTLPESVVVTVLPADVRRAENWSFEETNVTEVFKKKAKYKVHMFLRITSSTLRPKVTVFNTGNGPNLVCTCFLLIKWHECICPIHSMSLKTT